MLLERFFCITQLVCEVILLLNHAITVSPVLLLRRLNDLPADEGEAAGALDASVVAARAAPISAKGLAARARGPEGLLSMGAMLLRDGGLLWRGAATLVTGYVAGCCAGSDGLQQRFEPVLLIVLLCNGMKRSRTVGMIWSRPLSPPPPPHPIPSLTHPTLTRPHTPTRTHAPST